MDHQEAALNPELQRLATLVDEQLECFATGSQSIRVAGLNAAKFLFDLSLESEKSSIAQINDLITSLQPSQAPLTRSQRNALEQGVPPPTLLVPTPLTSLFVDGMNEDQIWAQLDIRLKNICHTLDFVLETGPPGDTRDKDDSEDSSEGEDDDVDDEFDDDQLKRIMTALENGEEIDFDALRQAAGSDDLLDDGDTDNSSEETETENGGEGNDAFEVGEGEAVMNLRDPEEEGHDDQPPLTSDTFWKHAIGKRKKALHSELDDEFFDLATFNAETEEKEAKSSSGGRLGGKDDSDSEMSVDLFAPLDDGPPDKEDKEDDDSALITYTDFFDPPPRPSGPRIRLMLPKEPPARPPGRVRFNDQVRVKVLDKGKSRAVENSAQVSNEKVFQDAASEGDDLGWGDGSDEDEVEDLESDSSGSDDEESDTDTGEDEDVDDRRAIIERSKDDLFAEDEPIVEGDLSRHEKRLADLKAKIAELETENVGPKDWVLMGEADSRKRPQNSLLEEDLEFERAMKVIPVVTEENVQILEELIKARILEGRFDDVVRLKLAEEKPFLPSRYFELKDTKSTQSLAQIYEDEYVAAQTGGVVGEDRDGKLRKEHEEIEKLWEKISNKLDALCNTHFTPKPPKAVISTTSNVSTATLESTLPTTQSVSTLLAPEEVYAPLLQVPRARSEMTPQEKKALHTKQRKAKKKARDELDKTVDKFAKARGISGVKKQKQAVLESVVKSGKGVTVVGKPKMGTKNRKKGKS